MSIERLAEHYKKCGISLSHVDSDLHVEVDEHKFKCTLDHEWMKSIDDFFKARQYSFEESSHTLTSYKSVEIQLVRLNPFLPPGAEHTFVDGKTASVVVSQASKEFVLAFHCSDSYLKPI